jgi:threonyl-tRNA synthetase
LAEYGYRLEIDDRNEKVGFKIREAEVQKIPYMVIVGDKEMENNIISLRHKGEGDLGQMEVNDLLEKVKNELYS